MSSCFPQPLAPALQHDHRCTRPGALADITVTLIEAAKPDSYPDAPRNG